MYVMLWNELKISGLLLTYSKLLVGSFLIIKIHLKYFQRLDKISFLPSSEMQKIIKPIYNVLLHFVLSIKFVEIDVFWK